MNLKTSDLYKLHGVGNRTIIKLNKLGIFCIKDLVYTFPYKYTDRTKYLKIKQIKNDLTDLNYHSIGIVRNIKLINTKNKKTIITHTIEDNEDKINVIWFNFKQIINFIKEGDKIVFTGMVNKSKLINPIFKKICTDDDIKEFAIIEPVYPEKNGIKTTKFLSKLIKEVFNNNLYFEQDFIDLDHLSKLDLIEINDALKNIHLPQNLQLLNLAIKRLAFNEIYEIVYNAFLIRKKIKSLQASPIKINYSLEQKIIQKLPYELTESQKKSLSEIYNDIKKNKPMHRLLNGDVGSGKTIVAALAILQVINNNKQAVLLAPTGILALQHFKFLTQLFSNLNEFKIHLMVSGNKKVISQDSIFVNAINDKNNKEVFVGTHSLLYNTELLKNVGLVVIDEQHKFGVKQREILENLKSFGDAFLPHVLSMSATPIPRSLALTIYGDLDISFLHKPEMRKKIITRFIPNKEVEKKMYSWLREKIQNEKIQAYVVCSMIEESEKYELASAKKKYEEIKNIFPDLNVDVLHGKLKQNQKSKIISDFINRKIDILVSTSVIEVGIDNPNANVVIIDGAERFGLAQLHQIRGRVGRSDKLSYCFLITTNFVKLDRIIYFCSVDDGFKIAEYDLKTRGPGELYGYEQTGLPNLKIANINDINLINQVKDFIINEIQLN